MATLLSGTFIFGCLVTVKSLSYNSYHHPYPQTGIFPDEFQPEHKDQETCSCICSYDRPEESKCEWKTAFKAVKGSGRSVYQDYINEGNINVGVHEATSISGLFTYRDGSILDNWDHLNIEQVKIEVFFKYGLRAWFLFNAIGTDNVGWMAKHNIIASSYKNIQEETFSQFSVSGSESENLRFVINSVTDTCGTDCGYMVVVDPDESQTCSWEQLGSYPYFIYSSLPTCATYSDSDDIGIGDTFVISVLQCEI